MLLLVWLLNWGKIPPLGGGFYCDDPSLRHPFLEDTLDTELLVPTCAIAPFLVVRMKEVENQGLQGRDVLVKISLRVCNA